MKSNNTIDELHDAPLLKGIPAHDPFVVPEGFFERFPHQVQERMRTPEGSLSRAMRALYGSTLVRWSGAITGILLLAFGASTLLNAPPRAKGDDHASVSSTGPEEPDAGYWSESELLWYTEGTTELMAYSGDDVRTEDLLYYLDNEDLPLDLLSEEL